MKKRIFSIVLAVVMAITYASQTVNTFAATEKAVYPKRIMYISQKAGVGSHVGSYALDNSSANDRNVYAPFSGKIVRLEREYKYGNAIWFQSENDVLFADGSTGSMTMYLAHINNDDFNELKLDDAYKNSRIFAQGDLLYREGSFGYATGVHIHMECARGRVSSVVPNSQGTYMLPNSVEPWKVLYVSSDTQIANDGGYSWVKTDSVQNITPGISITGANSPPNTIRSGDGFSATGTINSNINFKYIALDIYRQGTWVAQASTGTDKDLGVKSYDISTLNIDPKIRVLEPGTYTYVVYAKDMTNYNLNLVEKAFTITPPSTMSISGANSPPDTIKKGDGFSATGTINSTYNFKYIALDIYKGTTVSKNNWVAQASTGTDRDWGVKIYDVSTLNIDPKIRALEPGIYTYIVYAKDVHNYHKNLIEKTFTVTSAIQPPYLDSPIIMTIDFPEGKRVSMSCKASGGIYYTIDGSEPTLDSRKFTESFTLMDEGTYTIKAAGYVSDISKFTQTITTKVTVGSKPSATPEPPSTQEPTPEPTQTQESTPTPDTPSIPELSGEPESTGEAEKPLNGEVSIPGELNGINLSAIMTDVGVKFDWSPSNNGLGYRIYRSQSQGAEGESISDFPITGVSQYVDVNVKADTQYYYTICEVTSEASLNQETVTLTPEQVGEISEELAIETKIIQEPIDSGSENSFIIMDIGRHTMQVGDKTTEIDPGRGTTPVIQNGRTMVPIRAIIEAMGGTVEWNDAERKVSLSANGHNVEMWLDKTSIVADGVSKEVDVAPQTINDRTMLPIRFVADNIGCQTGWIGSTQQIIIVFPKQR